MADKYWKHYATRLRGRKPSVNQMDIYSLVTNIRDGKLFILKINEDGSRELIEFIGGPPGSFENHSRAHQIDSIADHLPSEEKGKIVSTNEVTGAIELIDRSSCDRHFEYSQGTPLLSWSIIHNLGKYPSVTITDSSGTELECEVIHNDLNSLTLNFSEPFAGNAYLN